MSSLVYVDLLTSEYVTGTSVVNSVQSEAPDAPTGLTATSRPRSIELNWTLGEFWKLNGIVEIWEYTANTPFASATLIMEVRGTRAIIQKTDTTTRYYWVRIRTIANQTSATEPAGNGLAGTAARVDTADLEPGAATIIQTVEDAGPDNFNPASGGDGYLTVSGAGLDADAVLNGIFTFDASIASAAFICNVTLRVTWSGGSEVSLATQVLNTASQSFTLQSTFTTLPAGTAWTMEVGVSGNANLTIARAHIRAETIKR